MANAAFLRYGEPAPMTRLPRYIPIPQEARGRVTNRNFPAKARGHTYPCGSPRPHGDSHASANTKEPTMTGQAKNKCAHPSCSCAAGNDSKYCSAYCEDAKDTTELACNCGHPGCEMGNVKAEEPAA
jgi:hypothetical protein